MTPPATKPFDQSQEDRLDRIETALLKLTDAVGKFDQRQQAFDQRQQAFEEHLQVFDRRQRAFEEHQRAFEERLQAFDEQQQAFDRRQQGFDEGQLKQWGGIAEIKGRLSGIEIVMRGLPTTWTLAGLIFVIFSAAFVLLRFGLPHGTPIP